MGKFTKENISSNGKLIIKITKMTDHKVYNEVLKSIKMAEKNRRVLSVNVDLSKVYDYAYPNTIVPISAMIDYYKKNKKELPIKLTNIKNKYLKRTNMNNPKIITSHEIQKNKDSIFDRVWKFSNEKEIKLISDKLFQNVSSNFECEKGIINAMSWCVNEVMDNTLRHSKCSTGFFMAQNHHNKKHLVFTIYDYGIGLYNSFYLTKYLPKSDVDSIKLAMTKNVTSDLVNGRGFGLWGLNEIIKLNKGSLNISSGNAAYLYRNIDSERSDFYTNLSYLSNKQKSTVVDFQLKYSNPINLQEVLYSGAYESFEILLESIEDQNGVIIFSLKDHTTGTGTRISGMNTRILLYNIIKERDNLIVIDFSDIKYMASSYADELFGKIAEEFGFDFFKNRIRLRNLSQDIQLIVSHAINDRINNQLT